MEKLFLWYGTLDKMKAVDSKNLTQLESMASVLIAQNMVLYWVYMITEQETVWPEELEQMGLRERQLPSSISEAKIQVVIR